jgi:hypothetical protein
LKEKRKYERYKEILEIKVTWPGKETHIGSTRDFSDGGTFILVNFDPKPPTDMEMLLQLNSLAGGIVAPVLRARVVRTTAEGIAFEFIQV